MNGSNQISLDTVVTVLLGCAVLLYTAAAIIVSKLIKMRIAAEIKANKQTPSPGDFIENYCRLISADSSLKYASLILAVVSSLIFALGMMKIFASLIQLVFPERMLGYTLLISYCGLTHSLRLIKAEINNAFHKLFA